MPIDAECGINMDNNQLHLSRAEMSKDLWVPPTNGKHQAIRGQIY